MPLSRFRRAEFAGGNGLECGFNRAGSRNRIVCPADRTANDQNAGAIIARLTRGDDALLIADLGIRGAQSGHNEIAIMPLLMDRPDFMARTDNPVETGCMSQIGKPQRLIDRGRDGLDEIV